MMSGDSQFQSDKGFSGTDDATIDARGRVLLSKKKRDRLGENFAMALGEDGCICVFPGAAWQEIVGEIYKYPPNNQGRRDYSRLRLADADDELNCDPQGRVVIPKRLQAAANLAAEQKVEVIGNLDCIEIWDTNERRKYNANPAEYSSARKSAMQTAYEAMVNGPKRTSTT